MMLKATVKNASIRHSAGRVRNANEYLDSSIKNSTRFKTKLMTMIMANALLLLVILIWIKFFFRKTFSAGQSYPPSHTALVSYILLTKNIFERLLFRLDLVFGNEHHKSNDADNG